MAIKFTCPHCQRHIEADDEMAGESAACECGQPLTVPVPDRLKVAQPVKASAPVGSEPVTSTVAQSGGSPLTPPVANIVTGEGLYDLLLYVGVSLVVLGFLITCIGVSVYPHRNEAVDGVRTYSALARNGLPIGFALDIGGVGVALWAARFRRKKRSERNPVTRQDA